MTRWRGLRSDDRPSSLPAESTIVKIKAIRSFPVRIGDRNQLLVKVETDAGLHGWGESGLATRERAVMGVIEHYEKFLIGQDVFAIGALWQEMYRSQYFEGGRVLTAAISAIDIALYDIKGKALGVPVYELLGGRHRHHVPTFASLKGSTLDMVLERGRAVRDAGWTCIRLLVDVGAPGARFEPWEAVARYAEWLPRLRQELGIGVCLGIDLHHRLTVAETAALCQRMPAGTLDFVEEPIRDEDPASYAALRRLTSVPFAVGEEFSSKWQFIPYIEQRLTEYARVDVCNVGGFTEAMKVAGWCEAHYIDLMPHNPLGPICIAASVHLAAAVPNFAWLECRETPGEEYRRYDSGIFRSRPQLEGTLYPVPNTPGLGIDIDEEALAQAGEFQFVEMPHLKRDDGSHTNW
ncbi:mandelate racemase/muconate lactonizing enzyme family protein [Chelatococcus asaccharovorans]|uniref:Galactonate dehydratase n=1 Tax=Chelatococcus asaccharovorans TaxID=28210 RepID=A0A2V3U8S6_9HYPH|nr:mandelate racemase/muconate lactonizing enzyme family protein [Chelatococcus asaccharovorans]MBS7705380.1 mandelate racemase/muconate lactonizing enzyme family protein [Chelatococcus asaccharovorans]PXW60215.1 galactonate dehydratase [Chelatococcus asaccharovorans]CAH1655174.1 Galactonate dehydratase [Chelatococcus asaccharovorans]CAH1685509.1 Galactonate dehydratase [Chelatococcus asaccharovorans]